MGSRMVAVAAMLTAFAVRAEFKVDPSVMGEGYRAIWNDAVQRRIDADIETYRKADAAVEVEAPDGTEVRVEQLSHGFFFGAHVFNFNQLGAKACNDRYKALYSGQIAPGALFNSATVAFYWMTFERFPGQPRFAETAEDTETFWASCPNPKEQPTWRRPPTDPVIAFLESKGVRIHGHPLVWGNNAWMTPTWLWDRYCPESEKQALERATGVTIPRWDPKRPLGMKNTGEGAWIKAWNAVYKKLKGEEIAQLVPTYLKAQNELYEKRIREIAARYGTRVDSWDVVNESATDFVRFGRKAVRNRPFDGSHYGPMPADYAHKAFVWAQKYLPEKAALNLNDYAGAEACAEQALDLMAHGDRIDIIGSQMHLFNPKASLAIAAGDVPAHLKPEAIAAKFAAYAKAKRPVVLSEITVTAPDLTPKGQMIQAVITRDLYRAWFAVPDMLGIVWWNVVDDCGAPGEPSISGLFTRDMRPKTAYLALDDLINREWRTELTVPAKEGKVAFRGFRGGYRLTWRDGEGKERTKTVTVK